MAASETSELLGILRHTITELVRREGPDLTARQLATFLICYLDNEAQTVRGLAARLNISKPAVTRALDRLVDFDLVRRKDDPLDRRSILVQRTQAGLGFFRELRGISKEASAQARHVPTPGRAVAEMRVVHN